MCHLRVILQDHPIFFIPIPGETNTSRCTCGKGNKHYSTAQRCAIMQFKYTTSIRCPCLLAGHPCTYVCACHNCANPKGIRPNISSRVRKQRKTNAWSLRSKMSILYAHQQQENILPGPRTQLEYVLVSQILTFCRQNEIDTCLDTVQKIYLSCVKLAQVLDISQPLGPKTTEHVSKIVDEFELSKCSKQRVLPNSKLILTTCSAHACMPECMMLLLSPLFPP